VLLINRIPSLTQFQKESNLTLEPRVKNQGLCVSSV